MTRDQLRLVLQPDDQLVKIKTVTVIDDHSDGEHPGVEQDLQSRQVYFRTHPLRPQPHSSSGAGRAARAPDWALMLTRLLNSGERIMNRLFIAVLTTLLVALAGCSGDSASGPTPIPSSEPPAAAAPATVGPSASPIPAVPVNECLSGRYRLVRFAGVGERGSYGTGEGGDVTVTFDTALICSVVKARNPSHSACPVRRLVCWWTGLSAAIIKCKATEQPLRFRRAAARPRSPSAG